ncbi:hypothetical protein OPIT5_01450 [Opitutaceae bacterium TAV5]|nr:hypothetical protein OPIT5_01450 [Opitutaceae bacterium TAV5]
MMLVRMVSGAWGKKGRGSRDDSLSAGTPYAELLRMPFVRRFAGAGPEKIRVLFEAL